MQGLRIALLCLASAALLGCGGTVPPPPASSPQSTGTVKEVPADSLPPLGEYLPPRDNGRLEIAAPDNWDWSPRSSDYLAQFCLDRRGRTGLPRIRITVEPFDEPELATTTAENLAELRSYFEGRLGNRNNVLEPPKAMLIGPTPCVRYVTRAVFQYRTEGGIKSVEGEHQILETVYAGRLYTIDLQVPAGKILEFRDDSYAVVAGLRFHEPQPAKDAPPADQPEPGEQEQ